MRPDRHHQSRILREYAALVAAGERRVLVQLPTGGGKTHVGLRAVDMMVRRAGRALWVAHRDELVDQPTRRILADGWPTERLGVLKAGSWSGNRRADLTIASVQTMLAMPHDALAALVAGVSLLVLDEARHYVAKEWRRVAAAASQGAYFLGLDATPVRADGSPLGDLFDKLLVGATVAELVTAGHLVPSVIWAPAEYQEELAQDPVDAYLARAVGKRAIVFCSSVRQSRDVAARLRDAGVTAEALDGTTREDVRAGALLRFQAGTTLVLCNVRILTEGTDLPPVEVIIHAGKCGSLSDWIQKGGRGLRPSPESGKTRCDIIDLFGLVHLHGLLDDPHVYSLGGRGVQLAEALPQIGQCPQCFAWGRSATVCAQCGYVMPVFSPPAPKVRAADLVEVRRADSDDVKRSRLERMALEEVRAGRSAWRAGHRWAGTYGEQPPRAWMVTAAREADATVAEEKRRRTEAAEPLWQRMRHES